MDDSTAGQYANAIIAVGTGKPSTFIVSEIKLCDKIIKQIKAGNLRQAKEKISEILTSQNIAFCEKDLRLIISKVSAWLN